MSSGDRPQEYRRTLGKKLGRLVCSPYVARHTRPLLDHARSGPRVPWWSTPHGRLGDDGGSGRISRLVCATGPARGVASRRPLKYLRQQDKGDVMRRGLFALPIPGFVLLAYNAVVLLGGDPAATLPAV